MIVELLKLLIILITLLISPEAKSIEKKIYFDAYEEILQQNNDDEYASGIKLTAPLYNNLSAILIADFSKVFYSNNASANSAGLIFRNEVSHDLLLGMNTYFDYYKKNSAFKQIALGAELLHRNYEIRANIYKNIGTSAFANSNNLNSAAIIDFENNSILVPIGLNEQRAYNSIELEIGVKPNKYFGLYVGGFAEEAEGVNIRYDSHVRMNGNIDISENFSLYSDLIINSRSEISFSFHARYAIGNSDKAYYNSQRDNQKQDLEALMFAPTIRHSHVTVEQSTQKQVWAKIIKIGDRNVNNLINIEEDNLSPELIAENTTENTNFIFFDYNNSSEKTVSINNRAQELQLKGNNIFLLNAQNCQDKSLCDLASKKYHFTTTIGEADMLLNSGPRTLDITHSDYSGVVVYNGSNEFYGGQIFVRGKKGIEFEAFLLDDKSSSLKFIGTIFNFKNLGNAYIRGFHGKELVIKNSNFYSLGTGTPNSYAVEYTNDIDNISILNNEFNSSDNYSSAIFHSGDYDTASATNNLIISGNNFNYGSNYGNIILDNAYKGKTNFTITNNNFSTVSSKEGSDRASISIKIPSGTKANVTGISENNFSISAGSENNPIMDNGIIITGSGSNQILNNTFIVNGSPAINRTSSTINIKGPNIDGSQISGNQITINNLNEKNFTAISAATTTQLIANSPLIQNIDIQNNTIIFNSNSLNTSTLIGITSGSLSGGSALDIANIIRAQNNLISTGSTEPNNYVAIN